MASGAAAKDRQVKITRGTGRDPKADPDEVRVPSDGKVTWTLDTDAEEWFVLLDGKSPFRHGKTFFQAKGKGSKQGEKINPGGVSDGDSFKYWIFWRDADGKVGVADPRIVIYD